MPLASTLRQEPCLIPADCFNRMRIMQKRQGGSLVFALPGLSDNLMQVNGVHWQCWNRPLNTLLLTWHDFRIGERHDLAAPIGCTLSVHHSYSRTIIHRVYDSVEAYCVQSLPPPEQFTLLKI
jgi:hypothetical protein